LSRGRRSAIAAGQPKTPAAATHALQHGGNAFDGVIAPQFAATVVESLLTALGGGFLLTHPEGQSEQVATSSNRRRAVSRLNRALQTSSRAPG
jgi:gamma-glutamyltranspeptidase